MTLLYAARFSQSELGRLVAFYESPLGVRAAAAQGDLVAGLQPLVGQLIREHLEEFKATVLRLPSAPEPGRRETDADKALLDALGAGSTQPKPAARPASTRKLAGRLLEAMDFDQSFSEQFVRVVLPRLRQPETGAKPASDQWEFLLKYLTAEALKPHVIEWYASAFNDEDLLELVKFYQSPLGRHLVAAQKEMSSEAVST
ncbi:MAG: DUF2059 domain-containing protein [Gemmatimonadales bacterium]